MSIDLGEAMRAVLHRKHSSSLRQVLESLEHLVSSDPSLTPAPSGSDLHYQHIFQRLGIPVLRMNLFVSS